MCHILPPEEIGIHDCFEASMVEPSPPRGLPQGQNAAGNLLSALGVLQSLQQGRAAA